MSEEETQTSESTDGNTDKGNQPEELSKAAKLRKENEELATELKEKRRLIKEEEELDQEKSMSGKSEGGTPAVKPKEETSKEYAERKLRGE